MSSHAAQRERDAALRRISRTRRWTIIAAAGLTAGFAALVSAVAPGKNFKAGARAAVVPGPSAAKRSPGAHSSLPPMPPLASPGKLGLQAPATPPQSVPDPSQRGAAAPAGSTGAGASGAPSGAGGGAGNSGAGAAGSGPAGSTGNTGGGVPTPSAPAAPAAVSGGS